ncbi:hypothetical protein ACFLRF_06270 [Candidatus Altiarchaeota archaeon]
MKEKGYKGLDALIPRQCKGEKLGRTEVRKVLLRLDALLGRLPDKEIEEFAKSRDYDAYVKLLESYDIEK